MISKFQQLAFLLLIVATSNSVKANNETQFQLRVAFQGKFSGVRVNIIPDQDQTEIEKLVKEGKDIPTTVLDKYQVVMPYLLDGTNLVPLKARLVGSGGLVKKPNELPEPSDEDFKAASGIDVQEICQDYIWQLADLVSPIIQEFADANGKEIESIDVGVKSVGYKKLKQTYNVGFFNFTLKQ